MSEDLTRWFISAAHDMERQAHQDMSLPRAFAAVALHIIAGSLIDGSFPELVDRMRQFSVEREQALQRSVAPPGYHVDP